MIERLGFCRYPLLQSRTRFCRSVRSLVDAGLHFTHRERHTYRYSLQASQMRWYSIFACILVFPTNASIGDYYQGPFGYDVRNFQDDSIDPDVHGAYLSDIRCKWKAGSEIRSMLVSYTHPSWPGPIQRAHGEFINAKTDTAGLQLGMNNYIVEVAIVLCPGQANKPHTVCYMQLKTNNWIPTAVDSGYSTTLLGCGNREWEYLLGTPGPHLKVWKSRNPDEVGVKYWTSRIDSNPRVNLHPLTAIGFVVGTVNGRDSSYQWGYTTRYSTTVDDSRNSHLTHMRLSEINCQFDANYITGIQVKYHNPRAWNWHSITILHGRWRRESETLRSRSLSLSSKESIHGIHLHRCGHGPSLHVCYIEFFSSVPGKSVACGSMANWKAAADRKPGETWSFANVKDVGQEVLKYIRTAYSGDTMTQFGIVQGRPNGFRQSI